MTLSSSAKPRTGSGGKRRRAAGPQIVEAVPGMAGGALGAAGLTDRTYRPDATCGEGADALADGSAVTTTGAGAACDGVAGVGAAPCAKGGAVCVAAGLRLWLARARALGLTLPQIVFELHVRQGLPLLAVAQVLGLGVEAVREVWGQSRAARAAQGPQSESDFATIREHISAALWQTVEATFPDVMANADDDEDADPPAAATPPMLSVRLKALDQIAKLYDLSLEQRSSDSGPLPYATPDDIADDVRLRVLEMHRRGECGGSHGE
ncbi:hypothetical protein [Prosthecobacter sp.]|uniref:hypothetical protein n=1 Tax=Prosthecobacter sp. TaxID=1965333 RepID=UPI002487B93D|nr:hypothetical protein [Prosthecobacter sp.]MDI1313816.1 hypothetical protein [Prosthecobacter sp.]